MKDLKYILLCTFCITICNISNGQNSFSTDYDNLNPVERYSNIQIEEMIAIHREFIDDAVVSNNQERVFFGLLFLLSDYMRNQDYANANVFLNKADSVAESSNNKQWKGHILHRKGIMALRLDNLKKAKKDFSKSILLFRKVGDSLSVAESLEQLSYIYGFQGDFQLANKIHKEVQPLILDYGTPRHIAAFYNNFAIILLRNGITEEAIKHYKESIETFDLLNMTREKSKALNNLADAYRKVGEFEKAITILDECISLNKEHNFLENLYVNYSNLSALYDTTGDYKKSKDYFVKFYHLRDSLIGAETQNKIFDLNSKHQEQQNELALALKEIKLIELEKSNTKKTVVILYVLLLFFIMVSLFWVRIKRVLKNLKRTKKEKINLTLKYVESKGKISELEQTILDFKSKIHNNAVGNLMEAEVGKPKVILTSEDWLQFKKYFKNRHPGMIEKLREKFSDITDAEERLFLLIKMKHTSKEIAAILGINYESVKKTRMRLRRRLLLKNKESLEKFVMNFK